MLIIKNGNVYLGQGRYEAGWDILCSCGRIEAVGSGLSAKGAQIIDASGLDVYPGLVLGLCSVGASNLGAGTPDHTDTVSPVTPQYDILYAFNIRELKRQRFARCGITSYGLSPGLKTLISGLVSLVHVDGEHTEDLILAKHVSLKGNHTAEVKGEFMAKAAPMAPATRMSMHQMMDETFRAAQEYLEKKDRAGDDADKLPPYDPGKEVLARCLKGEIPFFVGAFALRDIESVIDIGEKYKLRLVITGAFDVERAGERIIKNNWHVMLGDSNSWCRGLMEGIRHDRLVGLYRKGLKLSIYSSGDQAYLNAYEQLMWVAAQMSIGGAEGHEIMDMMTSGPAQALGVEHLVGSIKPGMCADLILCKGNPAVRFDNYVQHTVVAGQQVYSREVQ